MNVATCLVPVTDYDLAATLGSGQAFRWAPRDGAWEGVIGSRWVSVAQVSGGLWAQTAPTGTDWSWFTHYFQTGIEYAEIVQSFPRDPAMEASLAACRGLRLLRQDPWECLASFIASSTKQIVQIRQIVALLCARYGERIAVPSGHEPLHAFPAPERVARLTEGELRACKLGFRAPYLLGSAQAVAGGSLDLAALARRSTAEARRELLQWPGVGEKIANCVLLFAYGFADAFPVDVWVQRALRELYFPRRRPSRPQLERFVATYFGPHAGYAQQYLFHYMRTKSALAKTAHG